MVAKDLYTKFKAAYERYLEMNKEIGGFQTISFKGVPWVVDKELNAGRVDGRRKGRGSKEKLTFKAGLYSDGDRLGPTDGNSPRSKRR